MSLSPRKLQRGATDIAIGIHPGNVVRIAGVFRETGDEPWLYNLLAEIHQEAQNQQLEEVVLDLRHLSYANADAWRNLVLLMRLIKGPPRATYRLRMQTNLAHQWQRVGIPTLSAFGGSMLSIEATNYLSADSDSSDKGKRSWKV